VFATLGEIPFEVVGSPEGFESSRAYDFAEHRVIESKPRLQWLGNDLERLKFELRLHKSFTDPAAKLALLRSTAAAHLALPLVFGNGGFRGFFVIESIAMRSQQLSAHGAPIAMTAALALKEWAAESELFSGTAPIPDFVPLGVTPVASGSSKSGAPGSIPGVSALLRVSLATGASGPNLEANDVPASVIVRSAAG
jgi:phage protein U